MRAAAKLNVITMIVVLLAGCTTMDTRWQEVVSKNTIQDYRAFLRQYPDSQYAISAKEKIELLRWHQRVSKLRDIDAKVRRRTARDLGYRGDNRAVEPLARSLIKDERIRVREQAAAVLAKIGDKRAVEPLIKAALKDARSSVRVAASSTLLDMADPRATDVYIKILDLSNPDMRLKAAKLLVASKDPKAANVLARALEVVEVETSCLVEYTDYTVFGQAFKVVLRNKMGKDVASRRRVHDGSFIVSETLTDLSTGKKIRTWTFDPGGKRIETPMFLCLDEKGDIIRDKKKNPVMVKAFSADQRQVTSARYDGYNPTIKTSETTRIYPCQDCATQTGIKDCHYVW
jgi:hypothetical protein